MSAVLIFVGRICRIWLCCAVCENRRMYADIQQEWVCTVVNEIFLLLPKCHKWLCYAVCGNRRMYAVIRQERESTVAARYSCYCRSAVNGFVMRFIGVYKNGRCGEIPPCRKYDILQFRFIYQSVANRLCVIVSAPSDLRKAVLFIQLFCRLVITADFKKNAFYAVIFAFIYEIFH